MFARSHRFVAAIFGPTELCLSTGLLLVTAALWPSFGRGALLAPGVVLVWLAIPSRTPFISRPLDVVKKRTGQER